MSRSLLTTRLRELERAGIIVVRPKPAERGFYYELTEAGRDLHATMDALAAWGTRWMELKAEHTNPQVVLWSWCTVCLRREVLPDGRVVVAFEFPDERANNRRYWMLVEHRDAELCHFDPGFPEDARIVAASEPFTRWHIGELEWCDALRAGAIRITGPRNLTRAIPTWNRRSAAESITNFTPEPVSDVS